MRDIVINHFESAVFIARMKYRENDKTKRIKLPFELKNHDQKYTNEYRMKRWQKENEEIDFVLDYLEKHHPNTDYIERFIEWQGNEWRKPLNFTTEESKRCEHHTDEFHCNLERNSGCYTCCFYCFSPGICEWGKCDLLK